MKIKNVNELIILNLNKKFVEFQANATFNSSDQLLKYFKENREIDPCYNFNSYKYLNLYKDVKNSNMHPYVHYIEHGKNEGREIENSDIFLKYKKSNAYELDSNTKTAIRIDADFFFDEEFYKKNYKGTWGWDHYVEFGQHENRKIHKDIVPEALEKFFRIDTNSIPLLNMIKFAKTQENRNCSKKPKLSIIILNWNKSLMTIQCIYTIFKNSFYEDIEIIVVDNGSTEKEYSLLINLMAYPCIKILKNKVNRFYGEANNIGVEKSCSDNICLLNNDAFVGKDWDKYLINELENEANVGAVGPKFLYPDGILQEAGGQLNPCGQNIQIGKGLDPNLHLFNRITDVSHISTACFIIKRSLFDRINGFDYRYEPAYYEDADLTAKISVLGYRIRYVPKSEIIHVENATSKEPNIGFNFDSLINTNRFKFVEKWGNYLSGGEIPIIPDFTEQYKCKNEIKNGQKIAVIYSPYNLIPGGGERYALTLAISTRNLGYKTYFCSPDKYSKYRLYTVAHELNVDIRNISLMSEDELNYRHDISVFIAMSNELSPAIKAKGIDRNIFHCQFPFPMSNWHKSHCINNVCNYDVVVVNSNFTKQTYEEQAKEYHVNIPNVKVINPPVKQIDNIGKENDGIVKVLNVGRFIANGHCKKQIELIKAFNIFSDIQSKNGVQTKMTLIGSLSHGQENRQYLEKIKKISGKNVEIILNASQKQIIEKYQESNFYWHGTGIGENIYSSPHVFEHFGITVVEAISAGCIPIVWCEGGPKEILKDLNLDIHKHCAFSLEEYSLKTLALLGTKLNTKTEIYSEDQFLRKMKEVINGKA